MVAGHLGAEFVEKNFPGMCLRCKIFGYDLARKPVPVSPTAHYMMGGAVIDSACRTSLQRLFVAGEDSGGVHGANRLGGNGIADSCVFGRLAGKAIAAYLSQGNRTIPKTDNDRIAALIAQYTDFFCRKKGDGPYRLQARLREINWTKVGVARNGSGLPDAIRDIDSIRDEFQGIRVKGLRAYNMQWNNSIDLLNMIEVSRIVAHAALLREETRGAHFRTDYPKQNNINGLYNLFLQRGNDGKPIFEKRSVKLEYMKPEGMNG
jgi:succinate dehydrogenase / fumarate reductase flavoprotein subunit/fumarate reductase flavoprotein subunit